MSLRNPPPLGKSWTVNLKTKQNRENQSASLTPRNSLQHNWNLEHHGFKKNENQTDNSSPFINTFDASQKLPPAGLVISHSSCHADPSRSCGLLEGIILWLRLNFKPQQVGTSIRIYWHFHELVPGHCWKHGQTLGKFSCPPPPGQEGLEAEVDVPIRRPISPQETGAGPVWGLGPLLQLIPALVLLPSRKGLTAQKTPALQNAPLIFT